MLVLSIGHVRATDEQVAIFESSTVVTASAYAAYANDDWSLSKGGNNSSCGFNKSNKTEIGNAYGTSATTTHHGYTIISLNNLEDVYKITFTYTGIASANKGTPALYLGYSTDNGANWNAISLESGEGLSAQGVTTAAGTTYTFQFTKISSARYAIVHSASQQLTGNNDTFRFDNVTATFYKKSSDVIVKTLKSIAVTGMTTSYEVDDAFLFDGTCTATYSVTKNGVPQDDEEKEVTPTSITDPDMSSAGNKTITVSYTESEVTKATSYNITVATALPKIIINGTATGITGDDESQDITVGDGTFGGTFKQYSSTALWFTKGAGFIYNKASFGKIRKITINYKSGGAGDAYQWIKLGDAVMDSYEAASTNGVKYESSTGGSSNTFVVTGDYEFFCISVSNKNLQATSIVIAYEADPTAPSVTIAPTAVTLITPDAASGTIEATYTNVALASVTVGRFNDAECTEAFTGNWLTASLNTDKDIEYTVTANTGEARTAYIKLTAPASNGTSPDVVKVIEVSQAKAIPTYTALDAIFAAATTSDETVNITFNNWVISAVKDNNAYLTDGTYGLVIYTADHGFVVGNVLSGTAQTTLTKFNGNAELKGLSTSTTGLSVNTGGTITPRSVSDLTSLTGANAGSVITISGSCTKEEKNEKTYYYIDGVQLYNTLYSYETPTEGNQYNCTGVFLMYFTTKEILPRQASDLEEVSIPTAVITLADVVLEKGQNTTLTATVAPAVAASAEVTYSILDGGDYVSLSDADLTADEVGTAHIRATVADNLPSYYGATKDITVTVNPVDSRYKAEQEGFTSITGSLTTVTEGSHKDKQYITYEGKQGAASTPTSIQNTDKIRLYQNGGLLVIGAAKGCKIDQVFLTTSGTYNSTTIGYSTSELSIATSGDAAAKNTTWNTPASLNTDTVVIVCLGTDKNTRLEVAKLDVRYTGDPVSVSSIAVSGTYQTEFEKNAVFNHTGVVVTATYSDASQADVSSLAEFSDPDMSILGPQTITVTYGGKSTSYDIEIVAATVSSIALSGTYPTSFAQGAAFDHTGMIVTATYSDASQVDVTADATFSGYNMSGAGVQTVTVAYGGKEATYKIKVIPANTDFITADDLAATGSTYTEFSNVTNLGTSAVYAGKNAYGSNANAGAIQLRTQNSEEGIVVTGQNSTKVVKSVSVAFTTTPSNSRVLQVYGKHSAYSSAADLFSSDAEVQGVLIGTLDADGSLDCTADDYEFIGMRSSDGAMYLAYVMVEWEDPTPTYYLKNNWNGCDATWEAMTKDGDNYKLENVIYGGNGIYYNDKADDDGAVFKPYADVKYLDGTTAKVVEAYDTVNFVLDPANGTILAEMLNKDTVVTYTVAGNSLALFDLGWAATHPYKYTDMKKQTDGNYKWDNGGRSVVLPAGNVEIKVVKSRDYAKGSWPAEPFVYNIKESGEFMINIYYNPCSHDIWIDTTLVVPLNIQSLSIKGSWDNWSTVKPFTLGSENDKALVTLSLTAGTPYQFKLLDGQDKYYGDGFAFTRDNISHQGIEAQEAAAAVDMTINVDKTGEYLFTYFFDSEQLLVMYPGQVPTEKIAPIGGKFTINTEGDTVVFARGNLQYNYEANDWYAAEKQYEVLGDLNLRFGDNTYQGSIDLFGWSCESSDFGKQWKYKDEDFNGDFVDWGTLFAGGEKEWSTLTESEWNFIMNRKKGNNKLWTMIAIGPDSLNGLALIPDDWTAPACASNLVYGFYDVDNKVNYKKNSFTFEQWAELEASGIVFIPLAGARAGYYGNNWSGSAVSDLDNPIGSGYDWVDNANWMGYYWLSTSKTTTKAATAILPGWHDNKWNVPTIWNREKRRGQPVRLVTRIPVKEVVRANLTNGKWGTLCPKQNVEKVEGATFYQIAYLEEQNGVPFNMVWDEISGTTLTAGQPYFFIANATAIRGYKTGDAVTSGSNTNGFYGYIGDENLDLPNWHINYEPGHDNTFVIYNNKVTRIDGATELYSERCYININSIEPTRQVKPQQSAALHRLVMGISGADAPAVTTGIDQMVNGKCQNGKLIIDGHLFIIRGEKMFDATGRLVK